MDAQTLREVMQGVIMDCKSFTDGQLDDVRSVVPATIQELADKYAEGGGDREELIKAVGENEQ